MKKDAGGDSLSLNTNEYGEIVLTFQYVRSDMNTPSIDQVGNGFQVRVSTDKGTTWKKGYAGMKSHRVIAEGNLKAGGMGSLVKCYEATSEDLTALAEGEVENGSIELDKTGGKYGDTVAVTATPDAGYELVAIYVDGTPIDGTTFTICGDNEVTAVFEPITYTVSVTGAQNGAVTVDKYSGAYGETVTVTVHPASGYKLSTILVDGTAIQGYTFTIRGDHTVTALFVPEVFVFGEDETAPVAIPGPQVEPEEEPEVGYVSTRLALEGAIDLNFRVDVDGSVNVTESRLLVWTKDQYSGQSTLTEGTASKYELNLEGGYYVGRCAPIPAAEIGRTVYACAYVADGNDRYYSDVLVYSPMAYAEAAIEYYEQTDADLVNCMKWLVKYGHEASVVFKAGEE